MNKRTGHGISSFSNLIESFGISFVSRLSRIYQLCVGTMIRSRTRSIATYEEPLNWFHTPTEMRPGREIIGAVCYDTRHARDERDYWHPLLSTVRFVIDVGKDAFKWSETESPQKIRVRELWLPKLLESFAYLCERVGSPDQYNYYHDTDDSP
jgi:hypothetical protein